MPFSVIKKFTNLFTNDIAIDLGTANTLIYVKGEGLVLNEPSIVAKDVVTNEVLAIGKDAKEMVGRTHGGIETIRPLKDGVIADYEMNDAMLKGFIKRVISQYTRPRIVICIPSGVTSVERRSVRESAENVGASEVYLIEESMAAAIGVGIDVSLPVGNMIVDIGGGTTEIAIISLNGICSNETIKIAGDSQTQAIVDWFHNAHNLNIGDRTAEDIKCKAGSAIAFKDADNIDVKGQDIISGIPRTIKISTNDIAKALNSTVFQIYEAIKRVLDRMPPEHSADIIDHGIILTGGGALLKGLDLLIRNKSNLPVNVAENPLFSVVIGTGRIIEDIKKYNSILSTN